MRWLPIAVIGVRAAFGSPALAQAPSAEESDSGLLLEFRSAVAGGPCATAAAGSPGAFGPVLDVNVGDRFELAVIVRVSLNQVEDGITGWQFSMCHDADLVEPVDLGDESCDPGNPNGFWREGAFLKERPEGALPANLVTWRAGSDGEGITQGYVLDLRSQPQFHIVEDSVLENIILTYEAKAPGCAVFRFDGDPAFPCDPLGQETAPVKTRFVVLRQGSPPEIVKYVPRLNGGALVRIGGGCFEFLRGDCNGDGELTGSVTDAAVLLNYTFGGGPRPPCLAACDANGDGEVIGQVSDAVYLLSFNFLGGPPPLRPYPRCGFAALRSDEVLGCEDPPTRCQ